MIAGFYLLESKEGAAPCQSCAEGFHEDEVALFDFSCCYGFVEGERNGGSGSVAMMVNGHDDFIH